MGLRPSASRGAAARSLSRSSECDSIGVAGLREEGATVRLVACIAAALLFATLASAAPAAALTIGPPPPTGSSQATIRSYYEARLAQQKASYDSQLAAYRKQLVAVKKQKTAADKSISSLTAQLEAARSSVSSEQVSALTEQNEALKSENASLLQARVQQSGQIDQLTDENARLAEKVSGIRPPIQLDPLAWLVLVAGLGVGALVGLRAGLRRGENRAKGPIPENVAAWWGGDGTDTTRTPD